MSNNWPQAVTAVNGGAGGGGAGGYSTTTWISPTLGATMSDSVFSVRSPKPDSIKAVKLTYDNIRNVGAELLKRGFKVDVNRDPLSNVLNAAAGKYPLGTVGVLTIGEDEFFTGEWLVEEFDFVENKPVFRKASVKERQRFDLR